MAKKKQTSLFDQAKSFRDSDMAKAIGTVLAVLLIPASVIAWNYLSNANPDQGINGNGASTEKVEQEEKIEDVDIEKSIDSTLEDKLNNDNAEIGGIGKAKILPDTNSRE